MLELGCRSNMGREGGIMDRTQWIDFIHSIDNRYLQSRVLLLLFILCVV